MISEIKLNQITSYKNEVVISDLKKLNFFYGNNGSGKSTIAKYLYHLIAKDDYKYLNINFCSQTGFNTTDHELLVFDEKFVERNFIENDKLNGIFSLDEKNDQIDKLIKNERFKIDSINKFINDTIKQKLSSIESADKKAFKKLKENTFNERKSLKETFSKFNLKHAGSSINHLNEIRGVLYKKNEKNISFKELSDQYKSLYEEEITEIGINVNSISYLKIRRLEVRINELLNEIIIGNRDIDISGLIESLGIRKWVENGIDILKESEQKKKCPFCQEDTITEALLEKFDLYFDKTYKEKIDRIKKLKQMYSDEVSEFLRNLSEIELVFNKQAQTTKVISLIKDLLFNNLQEIDFKIEKSNEQKSITSILEFKKQLSIIIRSIKENNDAFENLELNKTNFEQNVWLYLAFNSKDDINNYHNYKENLASEYANACSYKDFLFSQVIESEQKIIENRDKTVDTNIAKENINTILKNSGLTGFEIDEINDENDIPRYVLKRDQSEGEQDSIFKSLSEGEKNFIAFLYFHQLCMYTDDEEKKDKKKIIVIDDPVSSLDSQVLFLVSTLIRDLAKKKGKSPNQNDFYYSNISQIVVLTHNTYFYKEVTFHYKQKLCNNISFYRVSKNMKISKITCTANKNSIDNDYNLLWKSLFEMKESMDNSANIIIGNVMRRILQSYLNFTKNTNKEWSIIESLGNQDPKRAIFSALISQINDDSHESNPYDTLHYQKINRANILDLFDVFEIIFKDIGGEDHFNAMVEYIN